MSSHGPDVDESTNPHRHREVDDLLPDVVKFSADIETIPSTTENG